MKRIKFFWRSLFPSSSFHHLLDIFEQLISFYLPHSSKAKECIFFFFNGIVIIMTITSSAPSYIERERAKEKISKSIYYEMLKFIFSVNRLLTRRWCFFPFIYFLYFVSFDLFPCNGYFFPSIWYPMNLTQMNVTTTERSAAGYLVIPAVIPIRTETKQINSMDWYK